MINNAIKVFIAVFASVAIGASGVVLADGNFSDVPSGQWYTNAVNWAKTQGLMNGTGPNTFEPDKPLTRSELAQVLYNLSSHGYIGNQNTQSNTQNQLQIQQQVQQQVQQQLQPLQQQVQQLQNQLQQLQQLQQQQQTAQTTTQTQTATQTTTSTQAQSSTSNTLASVNQNNVNVMVESVSKQSDRTVFTVKVTNNSNEPINLADGLAQMVVNGQQFNYPSLDNSDGSPTDMQWLNDIQAGASLEGTVTMQALPSNATNATLYLPVQFNKTMDNNFTAKLNVPVNN